MGGRAWSRAAGHSLISVVAEAAEVHLTVGCDLCGTGTSRQREMHVGAKADTGQIRMSEETRAVGPPGFVATSCKGLRRMDAPASRLRAHCTETVV